METCRCGFKGKGTHPCHAKFYDCRQPAKRRFYSQVPIKNNQKIRKSQMLDTWACEDCWTEFKKKLDAMKIPYIR